MDNTGPRFSFNGVPYDTFTETIMAQIAFTTKSADSITVHRAEMAAHPDVPDRHDSLVIITNNPDLDPDLDASAKELGYGRHLMIGIIDEVNYRVANGIYDLETLRRFHNSLGQMIDRQQRRMDERDQTPQSTDNEPPPPPLWMRQLSGEAE